MKAKKNSQKQRKMETVLIVNPVAGNLDYPRRVEELKTAFYRHGLNPRILLTAGPQHAAQLARRAVGEGCKLVVAVGGDGNLNEVINGIAGSPARLGIIPAGLSNVLARELGIPARWDRALEVIVNGVPRRIDLGIANDRFFALMVGVGFDAQAVKLVSLQLKKYLKRYAYHLSGLQTLLSYQAGPFQILLDDQEEFAAYAAIISNTCFYGGKHHITPSARIDDGLLHCCLFEKGRRIDYLRYFLWVLRKRIEACPGVRLTTARRISIHKAGVPMQADGDFIGHTPLEVHFRSLCLPVMVPGPSEYF